MRVGYIIFLLLLFLPGMTLAKTSEHFACVKSDCVNVRVGPGKDYPIVFVYKKRWLPVQIIAEFNTWKKIKDKDGDEGWVSGRCISNKQTVIVVKDTILYTKSNKNSVKLAIVKPDVVAEVVEDSKGADFIKIKLNCKKGWVSKKDVWGGIK